jgi:P27 family predicted phage terminase small subunit
MAAGRPPKPTALKIIEGNKGKRALPKSEPDPVYLNDLTAPAWLAPSAAEVWDEIAPKLRAARVLTELDVNALAMGCVAIAQYRQSVRRVGDNLVKAKLVEGEDGQILETGEHINPWMIVQSMTYKQAMGIFAQFGLTPSARSRVAINPQDDLFGHGQTPGKNYFA